MYFNDGMSCLHRNHSHVLVYMYSGELEINERGKITCLHKGDCAFIRKDFSVQLIKQAYKGEQFKAIFLMFTTKFLREFYCKLDKNELPEEAAHTLIQSGNRKVTDICFDVGFKNLSHFSKVYKERYSCSTVKSMNN